MCGNLYIKHLICLEFYISVKIFVWKNIYRKKYLCGSFIYRKFFVWNISTQKCASPSHAIKIVYLHLSKGDGQAATAAGGSALNTSLVVQNIAQVQ